MSGLNFAEIQYPAFVVVYGRPKHYISSHNRQEYEAHFACDVVYSAEEAKRLTEGYQGHPSGLNVYFVPHPNKVCTLTENQGTYAQYEVEPDELD